MSGSRCDVRPMRWSVTRDCGKLYVRIFSERAPLPTIFLRSAMDAAFVLEAREGALAFDDRLDLLDTARAARIAAVDHLDLEAARLGVAGVHPEELLGEERRFVAAGACADLEDHVLGVVRVLR